MEKLQTQVFKYEVPEWSSKPSYKFHLNVIKNGTLVQRIDISDSEYYTFGREKNLTDQTLLHQSVSRLHCVLQHLQADHCLLFDLGSRHRTWLNRSALRPFEFFQLQAGDFFSLGESSRFFFLESSPDLLTKNAQTRETGIKRGLDVADPDGYKREKNAGLKNENKIKVKDALKTMCKTPGQMKKMEEIEEFEQKLSQLSKKDTPAPKTYQLKDKIESLRDDLEDEIFHSRSETKKRRKYLAAYIDNGGDDEFYDRTKRQKNNQQQPSRLPNLANLLEKNNSDTETTHTPGQNLQNKNRKTDLTPPLDEAKRTELKVRATNLQIKLKRERAEDKLAVDKNALIAAGGDSLDCFMEQVEAEKRKRKIERLNKELSEIETRLSAFGRVS